MTDGASVEVDSVEEGRFSAGTWVPGRLLNGDERLFVLPADDLGMVRIRLLRPSRREVGHEPVRGARARPRLRVAVRCPFLVLPRR